MLNSNDKNSKEKKLAVGQMALIGLMTAILCIVAPFSLTLPFSPVPLSLGTLAIYFNLIVLGQKKGLLSVVLYILLGLAGLPVFSNFTGGAAKLLGPTGGYICGYILLALLGGYFADKWKTHLFLVVIGMVLGTLVCYLFGTIWLSYQAQMSFTAALTVAVIPFIPGDAAKLVVAITLGEQVRRRLHRAGLL